MIQNNQTIEYHNEIDSAIIRQKLDICTAVSYLLWELKSSHWINLWLKDCPDFYNKQNVLSKNILQSHCGQTRYNIEKFTNCVILIENHLDLECHGAFNPESYSS